jgi:hypothetical protein
MAVNFSMKIGIFLCVLGGVTLTAIYVLGPKLAFDDLEADAAYERAEPIEQIKSALGLRGYAIDMLSLDYLHELTDDQSEIWSIASQYWCGTPLAQYLSRGGAEPSKKELRLRAALLLLAHRLMASPTDDIGTTEIRAGGDWSFQVECARGICWKVSRN